MNIGMSGVCRFICLFVIMSVSLQANINIMDMDDLVLVSRDWLDVYPDLDGDFYRDGTVDTKDLARVAQNWLTPLFTGTGLTGKYYNDDPDDTNIQFVTLKLTRVDPQINFDWGTTGVPAPDVWTDHYSIRWSGSIQPKYTGTYTFYITSDDGTILRINNTIVADNYWPHGTITKEGTYYMIAGRKYGIELDYFEHTGGANCKFEWSCAQQPRQVVPQQCLYPDNITAVLAYPQMGWAPGVKKVIALAATTSISPPQYRIYSSNGQVAKSGTMESRGAYWGTYQYTADISSLTAEDVYSIFVDDYAWGTVEISQSAYTHIAYEGGHIGIPDMVNSFWAFQRSNPATYPDVNLPLIQVVLGPDGKPQENQVGSSGNVSGGWHDASSKDKSNIETAFSISNMCYALDLMTDSADRTALLGEMRWGTDYLLRIQNADGSFFAYMPDNPRRVYINKSPGVAGECARALAAASVIYQVSDPIYAQQCLTAAELAWTWIEANPNDFQRGLVSDGWCGYAGNVLGAAVELARATGLQKYKDYAATQIQNGQYTDQGWTSKTPTPFPGQTGENVWFGSDGDAYTGKSVIALCRFYPIANTSTQTLINGLCRQYVNVIKNRTNNPYSAWEKVFYSWFGFNQNLLSVSHCLLHIGILFNDIEALDIGMRNFEWSTGFNPLGGSFAVGFGDLIIPMFSRTTAQSIGGVQPGLLYINNKMVTYYYPSWQIWTVGETGLGSSPVVDILAMLNQYAAANTTVPETPAGLTGTSWETGLELTWNRSARATSYNVKRSTTSGSGYVTIASVSSLSYTDTTAVSGTTCYYVVSAVNPFGESGNSNEVPLRLTVNAARGKAATASSVQGSTNTAAKAVDGNTGTRWESQWSDPQWWRVDLGAVYSISRFRILWEAAAARSYNIQVSTNGSSWTTVYSTTSGPGGTEVLTISPVNARYVKMNGITRTTGYGYSFYEFEIFGY